MVTQLIKGIFYLGPLLFGLGFIAPLTAALLELAAFNLPFDLTPLAGGLLFGGVWGLYAQIKGSWL